MINKTYKKWLGITFYFSYLLDKTNCWFRDGIEMSQDRGAFIVHRVRWAIRYETNWQRVGDEGQQCWWTAHINEPESVISILWIRTHIPNEIRIAKRLQRFFNVAFLNHIQKWPTNILCARIFRKFVDNSLPRFHYHMYLFSAVSKKQKALFVRANLTWLHRKYWRTFVFQ